MIHQNNTIQNLMSQFQNEEKKELAEHSWGYRGIVPPGASRTLV